MASADVARMAEPSSIEKKGSNSKSKLKKDEDEMFEMDEDFGEDDEDDDDNEDDDDDDDDDYEKEDMTDVDVNRLMIVSQRPGRGGQNRGRPPSGANTDVATVINDGLAFYQKDLKGKKANVGSHGASGSWRDRAQSGSWKRGGGFSVGSQDRTHFFPGSVPKGDGAFGGNDVGWLLGTTPPRVSSTGRLAPGPLSDLTAAACRWARLPRNDRRESLFEMDLLAIFRRLDIRLTLSWTITASSNKSIRRSISAP